jgi:DNA-binding transcriptional MerR regulator
MNKPQVNCRLDFTQFEKLRRIQRMKDLKTDADVIRFLIDSYEDDDITAVQTVLQRLERKLDAIRDSVDDEPTVKAPVQHSNDQTADVKNILKIVVKLAEANPRVAVALKNELPELFRKGDFS